MQSVPRFIHKSSYFPEDYEDSQCWDDIIASVPQPEILASANEQRQQLIQRRKPKSESLIQNQTLIPKPMNPDQTTIVGDTQSKYVATSPKIPLYSNVRNSQNTCSDAGNSSMIPTGPLTLYQSHILPLVALFESPLKLLLLRSQSKERYLTGHLLPLSTFEQRFENNVAISCLAWSTTTKSRGGSTGDAWVLLLEGSSEYKTAGGGLHFHFSSEPLSMSGGEDSTTCEGLIENQLSLRFSAHSEDSSSPHISHSGHGQEITLKAQSEIYCSIKACHLTLIHDLTLFPTPLAQAMLSVKSHSTSIKSVDVHFGYLSRHRNGMVIPLRESETDKFETQGVWVDLGAVTLPYAEKPNQPLLSKQMIRHPLVWAVIDKFVFSSTGKRHMQQSTSFFLSIFLNGAVAHFRCSCEIATPQRSCFDFTTDVRLNEQEGVIGQSGALVVVGTLKPSVMKEVSPTRRPTQFNRLTPSTGSLFDDSKDMSGFMLNIHEGDTEESKDAVIERQRLVIEQQQRQLESLIREVTELRITKNHAVRHETIESRDHLDNQLSYHQKCLKSEKENTLETESVSVDRVENDEVRLDEDEGWETEDESNQSEEQLPDQTAHPPPPSPRSSPMVSPRCAHNSSTNSSDHTPLKIEPSVLLNSPTIPSFDELPLDPRLLKAEETESNSLWGLTSFQVPEIVFNSVTESEDSTHELMSENSPPTLRPHPTNSPLSYAGLNEEEADSIVAIMRRYQSANAQD